MRKRVCEPMISSLARSCGENGLFAEGSGFCRSCSLTPGFRSFNRSRGFPDSISLFSQLEILTGSSRSADTPLHTTLYYFFSCLPQRSSPASNELLTGSERKLPIEASTPDWIRDPELALAEAFSSSIFSTSFGQRNPGQPDTCSSTIWST